MPGSAGKRDDSLPGRPAWFRRKVTIQVSENADDANAPLSRRLRNWLTGYDALGCYCSAMVHVAAVALTILVLWFFDLLIIPFEFDRTNPVRATLADEVIEDVDTSIAIARDLSLDVDGGRALESDPQIASSVAMSDQASRLVDPWALPGSDSDGTGTGATDGDGSGFRFKMPEGRAVTRGSFTAWTVPENPRPRQPYRIIIEVRLPDRFRRYRVSDLSGEVVGTDKYRQKIPWDVRAPWASMSWAGDELVTISSAERLDIRNNKVQLVITVLGAERLVRDAITIRSRLLREEQKLELVFGGGRRRRDR